MKKKKHRYGMISAFCIIVILGVIGISSFALQSSDFYGSFGAFLGKIGNQTDTEKNDINAECYRVTSLSDATLSDSVVSFEEIYMVGNEILITNTEIEQAKEYYLLNGYTNDEAEKTAVDYMGKYNALYVEAIKKGYSVSDDEIYAYLETLKKSLDEAENQDDIQALIDGYGSEEDYWNYEYKVYQKSLPIQNYVRDLETEFASQCELERGSEEFQEEWLDYFESYKENLMNGQDYTTVNKTSPGANNQLLKFQAEQE